MTHYDMRYEKRKLSEEESRDVFTRAEFCTISTVDADGMPYGIPLSFVFFDNKIYIHSTNSFGHKLDDFIRDSRVCVSVVSYVKPAFRKGAFTTLYESALAFGYIRQVDETTEFRHALIELCLKYAPQAKHEIGAAIERDLGATGVWAIDINELSGKASRPTGDEVFSDA